MMRITILLALCLSGLGNLWAQIDEDFDHSDRLNEGFWRGDTAKFIINQGALRSNSQVLNDTFWISASLGAAVGNKHLWELECLLNFRTSSTNYVDFVLASENPDFKAGGNALFVRIGGTADEVSLYRTFNGKDSMLIDGLDKSIDLANFALWLNIYYENGVLWLRRRVQGQDTSPVLEGISSFEVPQSWIFCGLRIRQSTASFFGKHAFERLYGGPIPVDSLAPELLRAETISASEIELLFSETVLPLDAAQFRLVGSSIQISTAETFNNRVRLTLDSDLIPNTEYVLQMLNVSDTTGNLLDDTSVAVLWAQTELPERYDVLINELMPIPDPPVGLPNFEYVEIINRSNKWIDLANLLVADPVSRRNLPSYILKPDSIVVLFPEQAAPELIGIPGVLLLPSLPTQNNSGDLIMLRRAADDVRIDAVAYDASWFKSDVKASGGWSLERIDPNVSCSGAENWIASVHSSGGTPGKPNSVLARLSNQPQIDLFSYAFIPEERRLFLQFNREVDANMLLPNAWASEPPLIIDSVYWADESNHSINIIFESRLESGAIYRLYTDQLLPCFGTEAKLSVAFGIPSKVEPGELIVNEVLFNEPSGGADYIELYNNSDSLIDLGEVRMALRRLDGTAVSVLAFTGANARIIAPGEYCCICSDISKIDAFYRLLRPENMFQYDGNISLLNEGGIIVLYHENGSMLDSVHFDEGMHYALLRDKKGVSLERMSHKSPAWQKSNWTSASELSGFGTPGYENSQQMLASLKDGSMELSSEIISPDGDGTDDILALTFNLPAESRMTLRIYNAGGMQVRSLLENAYMGSREEVFWDGLNDQGGRLSPGYYVLLAEGFTTEGTMIRMKRAVYVAYR